MRDRPQWAGSDLQRSATTCPRHFCDERTWETLWLWGRWRQLDRSTPPFPGSVSEQPAWILAAFAVLDTEFRLIELGRAERERERRDRLKRR